MSTMILRNDRKKWTTNLEMTEKEIRDRIKAIEAENEKLKKRLEDTKTKSTSKSVQKLK